jgi:carotenoid cleavage dioxygenase-like enzyme
MKVSTLIKSTLVRPNDHPYLNDAWKPCDTEWTVTSPDLEVIGDLPRDLNGVYLRNGHNQVHEPIGRYHPFDGDSMVHAMHLCDGKVEYRNRFTRTVGFLAEQAAGKSLWPGIIEPRLASRRGWGSIGAMKDNAGTDILVHAGRAIVAMSQCSEPYRLDAITLETHGPDQNWARSVQPYGICSHFKCDLATGHMMFFNYGEHHPYMNYGVVDREDNLVHYVPIELPGPRWPHDLGFTPNYSILHDLPMYFDQELLTKGAHRLAFHRDVPARFGVIPRFGANEDVRWFEATPCYLLHLSNCYETGDEVIMDGCIQTNPLPDLSKLPKQGYDRMLAMLDLHQQQSRMHRWRFNMKTGQTTEQYLDDQITEFPMTSAEYGGRPYRYSYNALPLKGFWLLEGLKKYDFTTGNTQTYWMPKGCYLSEAPFAARPHAKTEDAGYLLTFVTNMNTGKGECAIFDARDIAKGPIARIILPHQVPTGTHACWAPADQLHPAPNRGAMSRENITSVA